MHHVTLRVEIGTEDRNRTDTVLPLSDFVDDGEYGGLFPINRLHRLPAVPTSILILGKTASPCLGLE